MPHSPLMGEGGGEGEYNVTSMSYISLPLPPPASPRKWGRVIGGKLL